MTRSEYLNGGAYIVARRGAQIKHARLNPGLVRLIRANVNGETAKAWAARLGVHIRTIEGVNSCRTWSHIS